MGSVDGHRIAEIVNRGPDRRPPQLWDYKLGRGCQIRASCILMRQLTRWGTTEVPRIIKPRYRVHLQSKGWRRVRYLVMMQAQGVCEVCGIQWAHHVHHETYERLGRERLTDLLAVCNGCHESIHRTRRSKRDAV